MVTAYQYNGKPIHDLMQFCRDHNTQMVRYEELYEWKEKVPINDAAVELEQVKHELWDYYDDEDPDDYSYFESRIEDLEPFAEYEMVLKQRREGPFEEPALYYDAARMYNPRNGKRIELERYDP